MQTESISVDLFYMLKFYPLSVSFVYKYVPANYSKRLEENATTRYLCCARRSIPS